MCDARFRLFKLMRSFFLVKLKNICICICMYLILQISVCISVLGFQPKVGWKYEPYWFLGKKKTLKRYKCSHCYLQHGL